MAVKYWYVANNGSADWSNAANWYNGSGGTGGTTTVPTAADDVIINAASGSGTLTIAAAASCAALDCTEFTGTLSGTSTLAFTGNITLSANMTLTYSGTATLGAAGSNFTSNGKTTTFNIVVNNSVASLDFVDTFISTSTNSLTLTAGFIGYYGTYPVSVGSFVSTGALSRTLAIEPIIIGSGTVWNVSGTNIGMNTSMVTISNATSASKTITHAPTTGNGGYDYRVSFNITGAGTGAYTLTGNFINVNCFNTGGASISFGTSTFFGAIDWGLYAPVGTTPNMNWNNAAATITFNSDASAMYFNSNMTITASATISVNNPTATTTMVISNLYNKSLTAPITVVGGASNLGGIYIADGNLITTSSITLTSGVITYGLYFQGQGSVYCSSLSTTNTNPRQLVIVDLYLTGSGTLLTATTTTNLSLSIDNIYVSGNASLARTLALNTVFYPNTAVYLAGSGSGSITLAASTNGLFNVYVTNTGAAPVSFSNATILSLKFLPGTNAIWSNAATQTLTIQADLSIDSSAGSPTLTPALIFNGSYSTYVGGIGNAYISLGGKTLVTGTITLNDTTSSYGVFFHFLDSSSQNSALTVTSAYSVDFAAPFSASSLTITACLDTVTFNSSLTLSAGISVANNANSLPNNLKLNGTTSCTTFAYNGLGLVTVNAPLTATTSIVLNNAQSQFVTYNNATVTAGLFTVTNSTTLFNGPLIVTGAISLTAGQIAFASGKYNVTAGSFAASGTGARNLLLGNGTWTLTGSGTVWNLVTTNIGVLDCTQAVINITDSSVNAITFTGGSVAYNTLQLNRGGTGSISIGGNNSFVNFVDLGTAAHSLLFTAGTTQTIGNFVVNGTTGNLITLNSTTTAAFTLAKSPLGLVNCDFLNIQHCVATPSTGTWYAGTNSVNNQAVATIGSGWIFTNIPPRKLGAGGVG